MLILGGGAPMQALAPGRWRPSVRHWPTGSPYRGFVGIAVLRFLPAEPRFSVAEPRSLLAVPYFCSILLCHSS